MAQDLIKVASSFPTQICFLIGGEHVTCHGSKLNNSLGRTKLGNNPYTVGKQQLEFQRAHDQVVHLKTTANLCASQPAVKEPLKSRRVSP